MEETKLERGNLKFQDQLNSSTCWKYMRLPQLAIYWFHGRKELWKRYRQISRSNEFFHILKIREIATDWYFFISWKKRSTLTFQNQLGYSTFENKWDCHRLLFIYFMEKETWKRYSHISRSPECFHIVKIHETATDCYLFMSWKKKKLERGTLPFLDQLKSATFWK